MGTTVMQDRHFLDNVVGTDLLEKSMDWIGRNLNPDDVFQDQALETWAESNGYVKQE